MANNTGGISMTMFIAGIVIAILASIALSTVIAAQFAVGPQGPEGPQGEQGIQGILGIQGVAGPEGLQGPKGDKGDTGSQGPKGDTGDTGPEGPKGDTGEQGLQGEVGPEGPAGGFGAPDYDSGWRNITVAYNITHNLGTQDILIYLIAKNEDGNIISRAHSFWIADDNTLQIVRAPDNPYPTFRALIWKIE